MTKYMTFLKPVGKLGGEMTSTHIKHVLLTGIRFLFYHGIVYLSAFKTYQNNKFVTFSQFGKNKQRKQILVQISKGRHFTVKKFYILKLNYIVGLNKNLKYVIKKDGLFIRFFIKVILN